MNGQEEWIARLLAAFGGDLTGWAWTGEVRIDSDRRSSCACGQHGLRFLFPWRKEGAKEVITGSVCVVNLPGISPDQLARVRVEVALRAQVDREMKAEALEAERLGTARALLDELRDLWERVYQMEARRTRGEALQPAQARLLNRAHDLHDAVRTANRLRSLPGRIRKLLSVKAELVRGLAGDAVEVPTHA